MTIYSDDGRDSGDSKTMTIKSSREALQMLSRGNIQEVLLGGYGEKID